MSLTVDVPAPKVEARSRLRMIDCDIHPAMATPRALDPFLSARWRQHLAEYGKGGREIYAARGNYPRFAPNTARRDAWPPGGQPPGSDLAFMQKQLLDAYDIEYGILEPLIGANASRNLDLQAALCSAANDWQVAEFAGKDRRLRASILVPQDDDEAAVREIEKRADDPHFAQVQLGSRSLEPLGRRRYWKIFAAAEAHGLPIGLHVGGQSAFAPSSSGWPSYYVEDHHVLVHSMQTQAASLILEGVFDAFPGLKVVLIEGGFAWGPTLAWRLDAHWQKMRSEVPTLKMRPSEYFKTNLWFSTQPMEEPENPQHLLQLFEWIGWDRVMFSTDYPHWDQDDPRFAFKVPLPEEWKRKIYHDNAMECYDFE